MADEEKNRDSETSRSLSGGYTRGKDGVEPVKKKRRQNFTFEEEKLLANVVTLYGTVIENKEMQRSRGMQLLREKHDCWEKVLAMFNSKVQPGRQCSREELQTKWKNIKHRYRSAASQHKKPPPPPVALDENPDLVAKLMSAVTGGIGLRLENSFNSDNHSCATPVNKPTNISSKSDDEKKSRGKSEEDTLRLEILQLTKKELQLKINNEILRGEYLRYKVAKVKGSKLPPSFDSVLSTRDECSSTREQPHDTFNGSQSTQNAEEKS